MEGFKLQDVVIKTYDNEKELDIIMSLVSQELSEPYSIFTYRYFLEKWPHLCYLVWIIIHLKLRYQYLIGLSTRQMYRLDSGKI